MKATVVVWRCYTRTLGGWHEWGHDFSSHWDARKAIQRMELSWPDRKFTIRRALVRLRDMPVGAEAKERIAIPAKHGG